ncbi:iron ABC transporter substrate-binding protein [Mycolicibacterium aromaticivorans JS19b1 = JCM 16368]|uniref:Iron ABC transporter substrate-binding protein n=1 Tax=Mycolicibacterium aromaticivorans JS19b1 = JCM 16368 TaxID=1440774 RepID=A0A064CE87_9MYCO|nr:iron ABC transporter substrate-binding protein [Mycolicibacterium aromaticivorans]KDE97038.1 iron ABC transporter substrate-binding protein [Mycolicibacterium aromaticivorans JS19b1 = JCM 16368]
MRALWDRFAGRAIATVVVAVVSVAGGVTACSSSDGGDELLVYNAQHESLTKEWIDAFTKESGVKVKYRQGGDTDLGNQIIAEGDASPADVFLTENSPAMAAVERAGLFADIDAETVAQVPAQYRPANGKWTGVAARTTVFVYNKDKLPVEQLPKSLMDLQDPAWKGRWGAPPVKADFQAIVAALLALKGEAATAQWLAGMKTNAVTYSDNIATLKAVNEGQVAGGIIYHYYWFRDQAKTRDISANTALHYFRNQDPGAYVSLSGGGVLKSSKKQQQAQQFLRFVTSKAGQEVLQNGTSFEYPVGSGVPANAALAPLDQLQAPAVNPSDLDSAKVADLMTKAGLL